MRAATLALLHVTAMAGTVAGQALTPRQQLGKLLFFDQALSAQGNQSCASCHDPKVGWVGANEAVNRGGGVYEASVPGRFGNRKPPSAAYATPAPRFRLADAVKGEFVGGNFWDGRATGEKLGLPAADQALGPFLNPLEQALPDAKALVAKVCDGSHGTLFREVWGEKACDDVEQAYGFIGLAIAAYEDSREVNQYSSKYDAFLTGRVQLSPQERQGLQLFETKGKCATCHPNKRSLMGQPPAFTDWAYDNVGVPANPANPFYANAEANPKGKAWVDEGLGGFLAETAQWKQYAPQSLGKHRTPTLRNVDLRPSPGLVKCYGHNGYFKSLEEVVHFYNTRGTLPACGTARQKPGVDCWPKPEVEVNLNTAEMGALGLTGAEEDAIVAFLKTLSDGFEPPKAAGSPAGRAGR